MDPGKMPDSFTAPPFSKACPRKPHILVVDDEPIMLRTIRRIVRRAHPEWDLVTARTGETALALLQRRPFDVLLTDLRMIGMQGRTLLELARTHHPKLVRIIHSAHVDALPPEDPDAPLAHCRIEKPASAAELVGAIEWALEKAAGRRPGESSVCS